MKKIAVLFLTAALVSGCRIEFDEPKKTVAEEKVTNIFSGIPQEYLEDILPVFAANELYEGFKYGLGNEFGIKYDHNKLVLESVKRYKRLMYRLAICYRQEKNLPPLPDEMLSIKTEEFKCAKPKEKEGENQK